MKTLTWWYRALLLSYPPEFRRKYGAEMLQIVTADADAVGSRGLVALCEYALHLGFDVLRSAPRERLTACVECRVPSRFKSVAYGVTLFLLGLLLSARFAASRADAAVAKNVTAGSAGWCGGHPCAGSACPSKGP